MINVRILADSIAPCGKRLTTWECEYPRAIHAEVKTHRALSTNSASSRAIPVAKMIERVVTNPWIPDHIGKNQRGMQAGDQVPEEVRQAAVDDWLYLRDEAVKTATRLMNAGIHKQIVNRVLEPWMHIVTIISATEVGNFFGLRRHKDAEPHFQDLANAMFRTREESTPAELEAGQWHLPLIFVDDEDWRALDGFTIPDLKKVAVGRCCRVSYLTHSGTRAPAEDIRLHDDLIRNGHMSPTEHVAQALDIRNRSGNFRGWRQYRKTIPNECFPEG